jgi:hypothetical protein
MSLHSLKKESLAVEVLGKSRFINDVFAGGRLRLLASVLNLPISAHRLWTPKLGDRALGKGNVISEPEKRLPITDVRSGQTTNDLRFYEWKN